MNSTRASATVAVLAVVASLVLANLAGCDRPTDSKGGTVAAASGPAAPQPGACPEPTGGWTGPPTYGPAPTKDPVKDPDDCFFYTAAWQNFLLATAKSPVDPAFLGFPNIATVFPASSQAKSSMAAKGTAFSVAVRDIQQPNMPDAHPSKLMSISDGVRQAGGLFGLVIDANGSPVYYSIHVNNAYARFISDHSLVTKAAVEDPKNAGLMFGKGVAEFKAAWVIAPDNDTENAKFITTRASVPVLKQDPDTGVVRLTGQLSAKPVTLRLIALHVAFVIDGHPEFIWATFEHGTGPDDTDLGPSALSNDLKAALKVTASSKYILFASKADRSSANSPCPGLDPGRCAPTNSPVTLDPATGKFLVGGMPQQTSVFREFPGSKSNRAEGDDSVHAVNVSYSHALPGDLRVNYRLVGATWLEHPLDTPSRRGDFFLNNPLKNSVNQDTESRSRVVAGEDALSSLAMESFTQRERPNCFACHDAKVVRSDEQDAHVILKPTLLNVSHVISRYLDNAH